MTQPIPLQALLEQALDYHQRGQIPEAVARYEAILRQAPEHPDALHFLGVAASQTGQPGRAEMLIRKAIAAFPGNPVFYVNLANAIRESGDPARLPEVESTLRQALAIRPDLASARHNLGNLLYSQGRLAAAADEYAAVLVSQPGHPGALNLLAQLRHQFGQLAEAMPLYRQALAQPLAAPQRLPLLLNLAAVGLELGQLETARQAIDEALALDPRQARTQFLLGELRAASGQLHEAALAYEQATRLAGADGVAWAALARCRNRLGDLAGGHLATRAAFDHAAGAHQPAVFSAALVEAQSDGAFDSASRDEFHRAWDRHFALPLATTIHTPKNDRSPDRRLRIGYLSGDFRAHPNARLIEPLIAGHHRQAGTDDPGGFEIHLYSTCRRPDQRTRAIAARADHFHDVAALSDQALVEQIEADRIDILIELSGHAEGNRLTALARRPAPIQLSWFGHAGATGLSTIDARITDQFADPAPDAADTAGRAAADPVLRLPVPALSCRFPDLPAPPLAATGNPRFTFGYCGSLACLDDLTLDLWSRLLAACPASRLLVAAPGLADPYGKVRLENRLRARGIGPERLDLRAAEPDAETPSPAWQEIDLGLGPRRGALASTCDALLSGVPLISLAGADYAERRGASVLAAGGLSELIAGSTEAFIELARRLADNPPALADLRQRLPDDLRRQPLGDPKPLIAALEGALRARWRSWCSTDASQRPATPAWEIAVRGGLRIVVPATFESMTPFVLLEQEDWFEDEIRFVRRLLQPGWTVLDIGANFGLYSTTCGRLVGPAGRVFAFEPAPNTARFLARSCALNQLRNVNIVEAALSDQDGEAWIELNPNPELNRLVAAPAAGLNVERVPIMTLDRWSGERAAAGDALRPDFIKLDAEGHEHQVLDGGASLLARTSPIVLFEIKHGVELNHGLAEHFTRLGFGLYRLIPGLGLLAPAGTINAAQAADAFLLNLFAIKPDRAAELEAAGLLASTGGAPPEPGQLPPWHEALQAFEPPPGLASGWRKMGWAQRKGSDAVERAWRYYAAAHDPQRWPAERVACLQQALSRINAAFEARSSAGRLLTLARIAIELGQPAVATGAARRALDDLQAAGPSALTVDEPLLPGAVPLSLLDPANPEPWLRASLLECQLKTASFGGCFTDFNEQLGKLDQLLATGLATAEMLRRQQLIRLCQGKPLDPAGLARLSAAAPDNLNADYWARLAAS